MRFFLFVPLFFLAACEGPHANVPLELRSKVAEQSFRIELLRWVDAQSQAHVDRLFTVIAPDSPIEGMEISTLFAPDNRTEAGIYCQHLFYAGRSDWELPAYRVSLQLRVLEFNKLTGGKAFAGWSKGDGDHGSLQPFFCVRRPQR